MMQKECQKAHYERNKEKYKLRAKKWRQKNLERARKNYREWYARTKEARREKLREWARAGYKRNDGAAKARETRRRLREEFIREYGGACRCCGETIEVFLTLEHKNRDGAAHRKKLGDNPSSLLYDLKRRGWPKEDYELLCFNCNRAKWLLGECPHGRGF